MLAHFFRIAVVCISGKCLLEYPLIISSYHPLSNFHPPLRCISSFFIILPHTSPTPPSSNPHTSIIMSWQDYVKDNLIGSGDVSKAAIIGLDGSEWATSAGFQVNYSFRDKKKTPPHHCMGTPVPLNKIPGRRSTGLFLSWA